MIVSFGEFSIGIIALKILNHKGVGGKFIPPNLGVGYCFLSVIFSNFATLKNANL